MATTQHSAVDKMAMGCVTPISGEEAANDISGAINCSYVPWMTD
jgi:hypothetical protein